jgi:hypothetical protein
MNPEFLVTPKLFGDLTISIEATYQARQQPQRREKHLQMAAETNKGEKKATTREPFCITHVEEAILVHIRVKSAPI